MSCLAEARRCWNRSVFPATRKASCIRCRTVRSRGADHGDNTGTATRVTRCSRIGAWLLLPDRQACRRSAGPLPKKSGPKLGNRRRKTMRKTLLLIAVGLAGIAVGALGATYVAAQGAAQATRTELL